MFRYKDASNTHNLIVKNDGTTKGNNTMTEIINGTAFIKLDKYNTLRENVAELLQRLRGDIENDVWMPTVSKFCEENGFDDPFFEEHEITIRITAVREVTVTVKLPFDGDVDEASEAIRENIEGHLYAFDDSIDLVLSDPNVKITDIHDGHGGDIESIEIV